ncbi:MAG TPA: T9SS type A sorting domain-containing protein [Bacteroidales bacterium]|nr:T9SS type A sorting domain-containing protein [Bacteroidales bacterium]
MKAPILFIAMCMISLGSMAQYVSISGVNQIPQVGDTLHYKNINTFGFEVAGTGTVLNKTWDLSWMNEETALYFYYVDAADTENADDFPEANLAEGSSETSGYFYFKTGDYYMARKGVTGELVIDYAADSVTSMKFPMTAGNNYTCNYGGTLYGQGLEMPLANASIQMQADAQGTLLTPNGSVFENVLRIRVIEQFDAQYEIVPGQLMTVMSVSDDFYYWYHEDYTGPILVYGTTTTEATGTSPSTTTSLRYQTIEHNNTGNYQAQSTGITIYPNPGNGMFFIHSNQQMRQIIVCDISGKTIAQLPASQLIDLSSMKNGLYLLALVFDDHTTWQRIIITD